MGTRRFTLIAALIALTGCVSRPPTGLPNPTPIANPNYDQVWDQTVSVLDKYFEISYESRYDGRIETFPLASATLIEPWRGDAVTGYDRLYATLQTIRRRGFVLVQPGPAGGFLVTVEIYKELENLDRPVFTNFGTSGTFITSIEPIPESLVVSSVKATDGWISLGRDAALESKIIAELQQCLDGSGSSAALSPAGGLIIQTPDPSRP